MKKWALPKFIDFRHILVKNEFEATYGASAHLKTLSMFYLQHALHQPRTQILEAIYETSAHLKITLYGLFTIRTSLS